MTENRNTSTMETASYKFRDTNFGNSFLHSLSKLRQDETYTDVTLKIGDLEIPCHKIVLSAATPYFLAMFSSGLEETKSQVINIKSTDATTLKIIVDYIYTSEVDINTSNVQNLVQICDLLHFEGLKHACEKFMHHQVDATNCIGFYKFAKMYGLNTLKKVGRNTMLTCFKDVVEGSEYKNLSVSELIEYISDDMLSVPTEDAVFHSVVQWTMHDFEERKCFFPSALRYVRLPYCTGAYLCHVVSKQPLMQQAPECQKYLMEAQMYHMLPDHRSELGSRRVLPRRTFDDHRHLVVVGGLTKEDRENRYCWYLKEDTSNWELLAQLPRPNWKFYSVSVLQYGILLTGGYHANVKRDCWLFDTTEKKWKSVAPMLDARCKHRSAVLGDVVYVVGGEDDSDQPINTVEGFHIHSRQWKSMKSMRKSLSDPLVATHGHQIFVFGGIERDDTTSVAAQAYDSVWEEWSARSDMPASCRLGAVATLNDKIYIVGGYTKTCMCYTPATDVWSILTGPREKHGNAPAAVWRGRVLLGGGDVDSLETTSVVEEYSPEEDAWNYWKLPLKEELSCHYLLNVVLFGI